MDEAAKVLFLDDEPGILHALTRLFVDDHVVVLTSTYGPDALEKLGKNDVSVFVSDNLMPGMKGVEVLGLAKDLSPDTVRIMLTGRADVEVALDAINRGEVFRFITKPWDDDEMRETVLHSVDRHSMVRSLKKADEHALYSLAQTIELKDSYTRGHCDRVAQYAVAIAKALGLPDEQSENIRRGSWLHDCGKIGVPEAILNFTGPLTDEQMAVVRNHPRWGAEVARLAHLPDTVINIILYHHERFDGQGYPSGLRGEDIPLEARIVNVADIYDALTSDRAYRARLTQEQAMGVLIGNKGTHSDPRIVDVFIAILGRG
jgi:putative nucleotidyltransferase with HDIG domain